MNENIRLNEDIRVMGGILYDSMQAYITSTSGVRNTAHVPALEVDAMLRVYCNYLETMMEMLDEEIDKKFKDSMV